MFQNFKKEKKKVGEPSKKSRKRKKGKASANIPILKPGFGRILVTATLMMFPLLSK